MARSTSWRAVVRRWPVILVLALVGLGGGYLLVDGITPEYAASAEVLVEAPTDPDAGPVALPGRLVEAYGHLLGGDALVGRATETLGIPDVDASDVVSGTVGDSQVLRVTVRDSRLADAEELAGQVAEEFTTWLEDSQDTLEPEQQVKALIIDTGSGSSTPVAPARWPFLLGGLLVGLVVGLGVARWRQLSDKGVSSAEDLEETTGAPTLGSVAHDRGAHETPLISALPPQHPRAEAMRILRTNLQFVDVDHERMVVVVTSAVEDEGKTTTASNLAIALAQAGDRVVLVEGDLRRPRVAEVFGLESSVGVTTALVGRVTLDEALQETRVPGLDVLASGSRPPNPAEILQTSAMERLLDDLREAYDVVVVDAPPLLPVADAAVLGRLADGVLLVVRHGRTGHDQVRAAVDRIDQVSATLFGTVLSMSPRRTAARYGYGYEYEDTSRRRRKG